MPKVEEGLIEVREEKYLTVVRNFLRKAEGFYA